MLNNFKISIETGSCKIQNEDNPYFLNIEDVSETLAVGEIIGAR